jgi:hypothetical protein
MAPFAQVVHALPGRKRIRIPEKRGDEVYFTQVKERLADCPGVLAVEANPVTGGVLVHHAANATHFLHSAVEQGLFRVAGNNLPIHSGANPPVPANRGVTVKSMPPFQLSSSLRRLIFLGLIGTGIVQVFRGNIVIPALAAFMDAIKILPLNKE